MQKKFNDLCKAKEKKEKKLQEKKEKKAKEKNFIQLRKMMRERHVSNDFKYFKDMSLDDGACALYIDIKNAYGSVK